MSRRPVNVEGYARQRSKTPPSASPRHDTTYVLCEHSGLLAHDLAAKHNLGHSHRVGCVLRRRDRTHEGFVAVLDVAEHHVQMPRRNRFIRRLDHSPARVVYIRT